MIRRLIAALLIAAPLSLWAAKAIPPSPSSYVHNESVVSAATAERLGAILRGVEERTGHQFVVALFQSLEGESLEEYANRLFKTWGIGDKKDNDGLLFCLFLQDKRWRVEIGYGLEATITDLEAAEIARDEGVPHFKNGDFDAGVVAVVDGLAAKLGGTYQKKAARTGFDFNDLASLIFVLAFLIVIAIFVLTLASAVGGGRRGCRISSRGWSSGGLSSGGGWSSGGGGWGGGGFSGGGGSSGGGGASGGW